MNLDFKGALATLARGLPAVLIRAAVIAAGGFATIIVFGMLLFIRRIAGASSLAVVIIAIAAVLGLAACGLVVKRFFLFRYRAAMLLLFSGRALPASGLAAALKESRSLFGSYSRWRALNLKLRRALSFCERLNGQVSKRGPARTMRRPANFCANAVIGPAVMALALSRGGADLTVSLKEGLALVGGDGIAKRRLARGWMLFSMAGLASIFLCLALPNWIIFSSAGAPLWIGIVLAAVIAALLHQAFVVPVALAGLSAALLTATRGRIPDPGTCDKLIPFFTP